ncbi:MAG TPA: sigma-70 family RNA polymerase sigma factor [Gemmatimonadaceae bacterium]|nr:sigma-70 family RNA polymerase sigma factor [Gemmatimonadaceae bacterium]
MELSFPRQPDDRELAALAARARDGSADAFERLATGIRGRVLGWAHALTGDADEAEDVAQVVLLRLHAHVAEFEGRSRVTSWVYRIVRNVVLARSRVSRRRSSLLERHGAELVPDAPRPAPPAGDGLMALAERCLASLPGRQRELFAAVDLEGRRVIEVAAELGMNPVTARVNLLRARRAVRLMMLDAEPTLLEEYGR